MKENEMKNVSENEKQEIMRLSSIKSKTWWYITYTTNDFNRLKNTVKNNQKLMKFCITKFFYFFCVCIKWLILAPKHGLKLTFL